MNFPPTLFIIQPNNYPTHSFLIYKDKNNGNWCWFEASDLANRGIYSFNTTKELITYQYDKYLKLLEQFNISKEEIAKIIITEFETPLSHIPAKEYLEFVIE